MTFNLRGQKVIICVGSGGVGKTTTSAALGLMAARQGLKVLVMTIDPSQRLKQALNLVDDSGEAVKVPIKNVSGELWASLLDAQKAFSDFVVEASDKERAARILENRLYKQLSTTLSGSQEYTSLLQLSKLLQTHKYDLIILDTPPSQHAIDFLEAPAKVAALFQEQVIQWFIGPDDQIGFFQKVFYRGTRLVLGILENITGSHFMRELNDFFQSVRSVQKSISDKTNRVDQLLHSEDAKFLLVTAFDEAKLIEAERLKSYLAKDRYYLAGVVINRAFATFNKPKAPDLIAEYNLWDQLFRSRQELNDTYAKKWGSSLPVWQISDFNDELSVFEGLEAVSYELEKAFH